MVDEKINDTKLFQIWSFYDETLFLKNISWTNIPWTIIIRTVVIWTIVGLDIFFHLAPHWLQIIRKYFSTIPNTERFEVFTTLVYAPESLALETQHFYVLIGIFGRPRNLYLTLSILAFKNLC